MANSESQSDQQRWQRESDYFDAQQYSLDRISPAVLDRYARLEHPYLLAEYPYCLLGDLRGKRILEIGCGDGANALILASKGATVVGIDLSNRAIDAARQRARLHQVENRATFVCGPLEKSLEGQASFDIVAGFAVLHHLLPGLNDILLELKRHGHAGTSYIFQEPVNLSPLLRRVRLALPLEVAGTPDERPLEAPDLALIQSHFQRFTVKYFHGLSRFAARFLLANGAYETRSAWRRAAYRMSSRADRVLFDALHLNVLSSVAIIHAGT